MHNQTLLSRSFCFAAEAHQDQYRKNSGEPYVTHPIRVYQRLAAMTEANLPEEVYCGALLHDTIEDTNATIEELSLIFGPRVGQIVSALTNDPDELRLQGKTAYLTQKMNGLDAECLLIKLSDRLDNVRDLSSQALEWSKAYARSTKEILDALHNPLMNHWHQELVEEIRDRISPFVSA